MDRRLTHWQCIYCRRETRNDARATRCWNCDGEKEQLRDADSEGREAAHPSHDDLEPEPLVRFVVERG